MFVIGETTSLEQRRDLNIQIKGKTEACRTVNEQSTLMNLATTKSPVGKKMGLHLSAQFFPLLLDAL